MADYPNISRYEAGEIQKSYDFAQWGNETAQKSLKKSLMKIGLPPTASRFDLAMRLEEIESERQKRGI